MPAMPRAFAKQIACERRAFKTFGLNFISRDCRFKTMVPCFRSCVRQNSAITEALQLQLRLSSTYPSADANHADNRKLAAPIAERDERVFPSYPQVARYFPAASIEDARRRLGRAIERGDGRAS